MFSIVSFLVAVRYIVKDHLGVPSRQPFGDIRCGKVPNGKFLFFFPIDLGNLLKYLDSKREKHSEITLVHITLKACAKVLLELPELNGQVIFNEFYPTMNGNIDVSMSHYNNEGDVVIIKVPDADKKDLNVIAAEVKRQADEERRGRYAYDGPRLFHSIPILSLLPTAVKIDLMQLCLYCGNYLGIEFEKVDVQAFPLGSCTVISSPNKKGETDMGVAVVPDHYATSTPVVVTISGIRIIPGLDFEKRVVGSPVLNCNVSINSYATTLPIARKFCSRLQELLAKPALLDEER